MTSALADDTLLFLKRAKILGLLSPARGVPPTHPVFRFDQTRRNDVSHFFFPTPPSHTNTNMCAQPKEKTTITAEETRCHVGS